MYGMDNFVPGNRITYYRNGFVKKIENPGGHSDIVTQTYKYDIKAKDSVIYIDEKNSYADGKEKDIRYKYHYHRGDFIASVPANNTSEHREYSIYHYDENWNLLAEDKVLATPRDSGVTDHIPYRVDTDAENKLFITNETREEMPVYYRFDKNDRIVRKLQYDGRVKRATEHLVYDDKGNLHFRIVVSQRACALTGMCRYNYANFWWTRKNILLKWKPIKHMTGLLPAR